GPEFPGRAAFTVRLGKKIPSGWENFPKRTGKFSQAHGTLRDCASPPVRCPHRDPLIRAKGGRQAARVKKVAPQKPRNAINAKKISYI
ncbi:MAG: hypothetical protein IJ729_03785, partial [Alloprevotella sp.]|nr:hypothetical protein [Alloprevotella sp.]